MRIEIRRALPSDVKDIHKLICFLELKDFDFEPFKAIFYQNICNIHYIYLSAVWKDELVGLLHSHGQFLLHHNGFVFEIQEFFVKEAYRKKGIGSTLLQTLEKEIKKFNPVSLEVTTQVTRTNTHQFYLHQQFKQTHLKFTKDLHL